MNRAHSLLRNILYFSIMGSNDLCAAASTQQLNHSIRSFLIVLCDAIKNIKIESPFKQDVTLNATSKTYFSDLQEKISTWKPPCLIKLCVDFDAGNRTHLMYAAGCCAACTASMALLWYLKEYIKNTDLRRQTLALRQLAATIQEYKVAIQNHAVAVQNLTAALQGHGQVTRHTGTPSPSDQNNQRS